MLPRWEFGKFPPPPSPAILAQTCLRVPSRHGYFQHTREPGHSSAAPGPTKGKSHQARRPAVVRQMSAAESPNTKPWLQTSSLASSVYNIFFALSTRTCNGPLGSSGIKDIPPDCQLGPPFPPSASTVWYVTAYPGLHIGFGGVWSLRPWFISQNPCSPGESEALLVLDAHQQKKVKIKERQLKRAELGSSPSVPVKRLGAVPLKATSTSAHLGRSSTCNARISLNRSHSSDYQTGPTAAERGWRRSERGKRGTLARWRCSRIGDEL